MNFGEQFKRMRVERNMTQDCIASQLSVSRQAVSHWENNKNLPDLEMLVNISETFHISLNELILGDHSANNITEKLIKDGSETRKATYNMISFCIGAVLLLMGLGCIWIKANSVEYIDAMGVLHENFFLLPISMLFLFSGIVVFLITGIRKLRIKDRIRQKSSPKKEEE